MNHVWTLMCKVNQLLFCLFAFHSLPPHPYLIALITSCLRNKITNKKEKKEGRGKKSRLMGRVKMNNSDLSPILKHFSHPHVLELSTPLQNHTPCSGCKLPPLGHMYRCKPCNFSLHLSCTQFPEQINHPSHPKHTLALLPTSKYPGGLFNCDACNHRGDGFSYHCRNCEYDLHVICASKPLKITHQLHQCQLELTFKNPYADAKGFSCDVCHKIGIKQWLYRCSTCDFDVHLDCSTSAPILAVEGTSMLQHHHSFPGATSSQNQFQQAPMAAQMRPNQLMHRGSTGVTGSQSPQITIFSGQVMPNQYMQASLGTGQVMPSLLSHCASTGSIPQHQSVQPPVVQGQVRPNQYMQFPGRNNGLMNAAVQGLVEGAAQQVGQTIMQGIIGGGNNNDGNEGSSILDSIFIDSSQN